MYLTDSILQITYIILSVQPAITIYQHFIASHQITVHAGVSPFNNSSRLALSTVLVDFSLKSNLLHSDTLQFVKLHPVMTMFGMFVRGTDRLQTLRYEQYATFRSSS